MLARLVVLDDSAGAERLDVDAIDLSREGHAWGKLEAALELGCRPLGSEQHLEAARDERHVRDRLLADERLEISPETVPKLTLLKVGELEAHALHRVVQATPQESDRVLDAIRFDPIRAELFRQPGVEAEEHLMGDRPTQACIDARVDALRID